MSDSPLSRLSGATERVPLTRRFTRAVDGWADAIFSPRNNPFYYSGAICVFLLILLVISGLYLFIFYKVSAPYQSVQYIAEKQGIYGNMIRGIHQYAADGLIIAISLHMLWVFLKGRYFLWRRIIWVSGVVLLIVYIVDGIVGYWMVWDERTQAIAVMTAKILDPIPIFIEPPPMGFLNDETLSRPLFFIITFFHLALPLLSLIILWIHMSRISRPVMIPSRFLSYGILFVIVTFSGIIPISMLPPADLHLLPMDISIDWFYLFPYPLFSMTSTWVFYISLLVVLASIVMLPWLARPKKVETAEVLFKKCTGCGLCHKDCPYEAIYTQYFAKRNSYRLKAVVIPSRCAGCGICVGSCNYHAIDLPNRTEAQIKREISKILSSGINATHEPKILGFLCEHSTNLDEMVDPETGGLRGMPDVKVIVLPCAGMIQPSMIEHSFKSGAAGVFINGCQMGDCHFHEGNKWLQGRLRGERPPFLSAEYSPFVSGQ